jgi:hypothetical protein
VCRSANVVSYGDSRLVFDIFGKFYRRYDARRQSISVVSYGVPRIVFAFFGKFYRRKDGSRDARRRSASVASWHPTAHLNLIQILVGVETLGVGFPASCHVMP